MKIGQTYRIPAEEYNVFSERPKEVIKDAELIQETKHLYVFKYKNIQGIEMIKSIRKLDAGGIDVNSRAKRKN